MKNIDYVIFKVLSKDASVEEQELFDNWLKETEANNAEFLRLKSYWQSEVEFKHSIQVDDAFGRFKKNKLLPAKNNHRMIRRIIIGAVSAAAAVVLLLFTVGQPAALPQNNYSFATGDKKDTLYLPDSSMVVLNKFSRVVYSSLYNKSERSIKLVGEAYFDVKKNPKVPFVITMDKSRITVLGTAFNVRAYANDNTIKATLVRGVIRFDTNLNENQIILKPNQELDYNKQTNDITLKHVDVLSSLAWLDAIHRYQSKPLEYLLKDLGMIYNKQISLIDKKLANTIISGSFRDNQSVDEILTTISLTVPIEWTVDKDTIRIAHN